MTRIALCAALPLELQSFCRETGSSVPHARLRWTRSPWQPSGEMWLIASGVGPKSMRNTLSGLPDEPVDLWISLGLAGGLTPHLDKGQVVEGSRVIYQGEMLSGSCSSDCPPLLCSPSALLTPQTKSKAHQSSHAIAVDMESGEVARHALSRDEPFEWIKVISDRANEALHPQLMKCIGADGYPRISRSMQVLMRRPWLLPTLLAMGQQGHRFSRILADHLLDRLRSI